MPADFSTVIKFCEICGKRLTLHNTRDIERKRFCSRKCLALGIEFHKLAPRINELTKSKMRKPHTFVNKKLWREHLKSRPSSSKGKTNHNSSWSKRVPFNGITFRSSWEAYFAKLMLDRNIPYIYEPQRFDLGDITYLPDFYLPTYNLYIEVKGYMDEQSKTRIDRFRELYPDKILILFTAKSVSDAGTSPYFIRKLFPTSEG